MATTTPTAPGAEAEIHVSNSKRIVLCFDGTGNKFRANPQDTNIVKLYNMLDRGHPDQMHYYQPGIGTYPAEGPVNVGFVRGARRKLEALVDQGFATSFDAHVIAGYRFIMRYYRTGDRIYIFGFSRGAFTARFLARMISHIGLLSIGNEEMVPFAYKVYQDYETNRGDKLQEQASADYMNAFKRYFCRTERERALDAGDAISDNESGVKVHFLGLFDCVGSVGTLDIPLFQKTPPLPAVRGTAEHVRHAVAIDERRVKFKAALFAQEQDAAAEDIKEVWFPGNHGDIGGGWKDVTRSKHGDGISTNNDEDYFQLSDIALKWMIDELDQVEDHLAQQNPSRKYTKVAWDAKEKASFIARFQKNTDEVISAKMHDTMKTSGGATMTKAAFWNFLEYLPFIKRWEFVRDAPRSTSYKWDYIAFPLNRGGCRDIPSQALFHHAVLERMRLESSKTNPQYQPRNRVWVAKGDGGVEKRYFKDVANQFREESSQSHAKAEHTPHHASAHPHFVHDQQRTIGSVEVTGAIEAVTVGPTKWDRIYRLALDGTPAAAPS